MINICQFAVCARTILLIGALADLRITVGNGSPFVTLVTLPVLLAHPLLGWPVCSMVQFSLRGEYGETTRGLRRFWELGTGWAAAQRGSWEFAALVGWLPASLPESGEAYPDVP